MNHFDVLADWGITNPTEADVWAAIAEANNLDGDISDGDLAEWL